MVELNGLSSCLPSNQDLDATPLLPHIIGLHILHDNTFTNYDDLCSKAGNVKRVY